MYHPDSALAAALRFVRGAATRQDHERLERLGRERKQLLQLALDIETQAPLPENARACRFYLARGPSAR